MRQVKIDSEVGRRIMLAADPGETVNTTLRRILGLPPVPQDRTSGGLGSKTKPRMVDHAE